MQSTSLSAKVACFSICYFSIRIFLSYVSTERRRHLSPKRLGVLRCKKWRSKHHVWPGDAFVAKRFLLPSTISSQDGFHMLCMHVGWQLIKPIVCQTPFMLTVCGQIFICSLKHTRLFSYSLNNKKGKNGSFLLLCEEMETYIYIVYLRNIVRTTFISIFSRLLFMYKTTCVTCTFNANLQKHDKFILSGLNPCKYAQ